MSRTPITPSVPTILGRLYRGTFAFRASAEGPGGRRLRPSRSQTYGELAPAGIAALIARTGLTESDRFVDLGSGAGRVVLSVALQVPGIAALGVEIDAGRFAIAAGVLAKLEARSLLPPNRVRFEHADLRDVDLAGGTVFFACSTCFPPGVLNALARKIAATPGARVFASMQSLGPRVAACFAAEETHPCPASWAQYTSVHLYWVRPPDKTRIQ